MAIMEAVDSFGEWLRRRRTALRLTRVELAECVGCSVSALRKIEADERRPSRQLAGLMAGCLRIAPDELPLFLDAARGIELVSWLGMPELHKEGQQPLIGHPVKSLSTRLSRPAWNLPYPAMPLIGREVELETLAKLLDDPACRHLTLVGPGGIGKTRLAIEVACNEWEHFADGVFFASLAATSSHEFMVPTIAQAVGLSFSGSADPQSQLINYLSDKQALLLLDNLEHLLDGVDLVVALLARAPNLKLLVTSRERLALIGEWTFEVQGLPVPIGEQKEVSEINSAVQLFFQRARQSQAEFVLSAEELPHVVRICQLVEGMPLAIELAATWVPVLNCREIANEIEQGLDILASQLRDVPERHRSMRAVFDHSWKLLTEEQKQAMRQLAVFKGGFLREGAQAIAGASLPIISALVSKSLIRRTANGRYDLHQIVHQFALSYLSEDPQIENMVCDRHCEFYLELLSDREQALKSAAQQETIQQLTKEIDNVRAAWTWAVKREKFTRLGAALRCFGLLFDIRGWSKEGIEQVEPIVQALRTMPENKELQKVLGQALAQQGLFFFRLGNHLQAMSRFKESLALLRPIGEPALLVDPLVLGGIIMHLTGELDQAHSLLHEGLVNARASGDRWYAAYALFNKGYIAGLSGRLNEGYQQMVEGITLWRMLGDPRFIALGLNFISPLAIRLGRVDEAQGYLEESLALSTQIGDRWGMGTAYRFLGVAALARGDTSEAQLLINRSLDIFQGFVKGWDVVISLVYLGQALTTGGDLPAARRCFVEALELAVEAGALPLALNALVGLSQLDLDSGEAERALVLCTFAMSHPAATYDVLERASLLVTQAEQQLSPEAVTAARVRSETQSLELIVEQTLGTPASEALQQRP
jgi:predicted ATPase/transcriptional regulator with XRE-family HTH domain